MRSLAAGGRGTICGMANLIPALLHHLLRDANAQAAIEQACGLVESIPLLKAALAAMTGESVWRTVRPPLRAADAASGVRVAAALEAFERTGLSSVSDSGSRP